MDFGKLKSWMKKMNQILDLYEGNDEFTETERNLLLDYTNRMASEIKKLKVLEDKTEESIIEKYATSTEKNIPIEQFADHHHSIIQQKTSNNNAASDKMDSMSMQDSNIELYPQLFDHLEVHDLNSKLELKPIKDIKQGMGLNEKILAQNELFNGDKNAFEEVIQKLNDCTDFNSAKMYLCESVIPKFNWTNASKEKTVDTFIKLVKRRHL